MVEQSKNSVRRMKVYETTDDMYKSFPGISFEFSTKSKPTMRQSISAYILNRLEKKTESVRR